jgi:hypothetical protein
VWVVLDNRHTSVMFADMIDASRAATLTAL